MKGTNIPSVAKSIWNIVRLSNLLLRDESLLMFAFKEINLTLLIRSFKVASLEAAKLLESHSPCDEFAKRQSPNDQSAKLLKIYFIDLVLPWLCIFSPIWMHVHSQ